MASFLSQLYPRQEMKSVSPKEKVRYIVLDISIWRACVQRDAADMKF